MTNQRKVILDAMLNLRHHVSLEELRIEMPQSVGMATLYRTMKLFVEAGIVENLNFDDGVTRYELVSESGEHHDHLICTKCGLIIEFEDELIESQQEKVAATFGLKISSHKMELYGICIDEKSCADRLMQKNS